MSYTGRTPETFNPATVQVSDRRTNANPAPSAAVNTMGRLLESFTTGLVLTGILATGLPAAQAEIFSTVDQDGRRVFINREESGRAPRLTSAAARASLMARRRAALPGIEAHIEWLAAQHRVDAKLIHAVIEVESAWDYRAVSRRGAVGLMQLLPETGRRFGAQNLLDPRDNLAAGVRYLRFLLDRFDHNLELVLAAYNAGENVVDELGGIPPFPETQAYVERIGAIYHGSNGAAFPSRRFGRAASPDRAGGIYREVDEDGRIIFGNH